MKKDNLILSKSFDFVLMIIDLYQKMRRENEFVLSKQLLRSGTSIGASVAKEVRETNYWLQLLEKSQIVSIDYTVYLKKIIPDNLTKIIKISQTNLMMSNYNKLKI